MMKGIPDLPAPRNQASFVLLHFVMESSELPKFTFCCILFLMRASFSVQIFFFFLTTGRIIFKRQCWEIKFELHKIYAKRSIFSGLIWFGLGFFFPPYLILESIFQPGVSIKHFMLMWLPELRVSLLFRVRKPTLTTSPASLAITAWTPVQPLLWRRTVLQLLHKYHSRGAGFVLINCSPCL